ncbi:MAG: hypothetical protein PHZ09_11890, partial [Eubacteriales bacterium]|nr:hypothetical protein [Eubacteriales bacterium]
MRVNKITAGEKGMRFSFDEALNGSVIIHAYSPALREEKLIAENEIIVTGRSELEIPRYLSGRDGLYLRYRLYTGGNRINGVSYAQDMDFAP